MANLLLHVDGAEDAAITVARFALRERLSEPFLLSVVVGSTHPDLDLDALILRPASFTIDAGTAHGRRVYTGICTAAEQMSAEPTGLSLYRIRIAPRLGLLGLRRDHRIYQQLTIPAILAQMLAAYSILAAFHLDESAFPVLDFKVQYGETDLAFFTRLCEEAGITFAIRGDDERGSIVVLSDAPTEAAPRASSPLPFLDHPIGLGEHVTRVRLLREARPLSVALRDFDFRNPALPLDGRAADAAPHRRCSSIFTSIQARFASSRPRRHSHRLPICSAPHATSRLWASVARRTSSLGRTPPRTASPLTPTLSTSCLEPSSRCWVIRTRA